MKQTLFILFFLIVNSSFFAQENKIIVESYNLRYASKSDGENFWKNRKKMVKFLSINFFAKTNQLLIALISY